MISIGVDIGGSHITSAAINVETKQIFDATLFRTKVNNKGNKDDILKCWASTINKTIYNCQLEAPAKIGIAIPGPFNYDTGVAYYQINNKYEALYNVNVKQELNNLLIDHVELRFINDATCFGIGSVVQQPALNYEKVVAITLGTGFGATFLKNGIPVSDKEAGVPENGCLWDKSFLGSIADDYISTRWIVSRYQQLTDNRLSGVREIAKKKNKSATRVFEEFGQNIASFLYSYLKDFDTEQLIIGGNIAKAHPLFLPHLKTNWNHLGYEIPISIVDNTEEAILMGCSQLCNEFFWQKLKHLQPSI